MFGVGTQELLIIMLAVLLLFGSRRIPEVARSIGSGLQTFRRVVRDAQREIDLELLREPGEETAPPSAGASSKSPRAPQVAPAARKSAERPPGAGGSRRSAGSPGDTDR